MRKICTGFFTLAVLMATGCSTSSASTPVAFKYDFDHLSKGAWHISNGWANGEWQACEWSADALAIKNNKLEITLAANKGKIRPYSCGELHSSQVQGYGLYEVRMRAAAGSGLNSAFFTYTGPIHKQPWDEIDFEFLGKNPRAVETSYYVNGKNTGGKVVELGYDASKEFHNYAIRWEPNKITWYVDGKLVNESPAGAAIPSHPGGLYLSLWAGGPQQNNWLGEFRFSEPVTSEVEWVAYTPAGESCKFPESISCT